MTENEIMEGNKLIAGFLGWESGRYDNLPNTLHKYSGKEEIRLHVSELQYHSSWDWLMPAWVKFRNLWDGKNEEHGKWLDSLGWYLYSSDEPMRFFERFVYCLKWYNEVGINRFYNQQTKQS